MHEELRRSWTSAEAQLLASAAVPGVHQALLEATHVESLLCAKARRLAARRMQTTPKPVKEMLRCSVCCIYG